MSNVYTPDDRIVVHFGSPSGETYGSREERVVEEFMARHPEFVVPGREE